MKASTPARIAFSRAEQGIADRLDPGAVGSHRPLVLLGYPSKGQHAHSGGNVHDGLYALEDDRSQGQGAAAPFQDRIQRDRYADARAGGDELESPPADTRFICSGIWVR